MDVLLVGGEGALTNDIIDKYYKEKHRVFWLSGTDIRTKLNPKVTGQFDFPLTTDSISDIVVGVSPDVLIYTGAYDVNFSWTNIQEEAKRFISGVNNLILASSLIPSCRMIYLSSHEVFPDETSELLTEDARISAPKKVDMDTLKERVLVQAEEQWSQAKDVYGMDEVILRLDHLFALPYRKQLFSDICTQMCFQAFKDGKLYANPYHKFSLTYLSDATEAIYIISQASDRKQDIYHISSGIIYSEQDIANAARNLVRGQTELSVDNLGKKHGRILSGEAFDTEFDMHFHHRAEDIIPKIMGELKRHFPRYVPESVRPVSPAARFFHNFRIFIAALVPFLENIGIFIVVFLFSKWVSGNTNFAGFDFYILYVLLFAVVYGQGQAIVSSLLSTAGFFLQQNGLVEIRSAATQYSTYIWIAMIFIVGLAVGYLKDQLTNSKAEAEEEQKYLMERRDEIRSINTENVKVKKVLEQQLVNQKDSMGRLYKITAELNSAREEVVLFRAVEVVSDIMDTRETALYMATGGPYIRLFAASSKKARSLGNSVKLDTLGDMEQALKNKEVFINRQLDENLPVLAQGVYREDNLEMIFMLWDIPWERLTLSQSNMLTITCLLIQDAVIHARRYLAMLHERQYIEGTEVFDKKSFGELLTMYLDATKRGLIECCLIEADIPSDKPLPEIESDIRHVIRQLDFIGGPGDGHIYALLTNTSRTDGGEIVEGRIQKAGYSARIMEMDDYGHE